jgi:hypothetical protein
MLVTWGFQAGQPAQESHFGSSTWLFTGFSDRHRRCPLARLFDASLDGSTRRATDFREGATINETAFKALFRAAVAMNKSKAKS